ncbi:MAG: class I SAM-dependent methyltransferase [Deltaproteobacteria bacterium]|nr:class I SAM-dependent methyltransferase [Deltaproteobacteria bacterium]
MVEFSEFTELPGDLSSDEQVGRMCRRYYWAGDACRGGDVLEAACGGGQGLGYLLGLAKSVTAGDYDARVLRVARGHYGTRVPLVRFDAQELPFGPGSFDAVILFEALYYVPSADRFVAECRRVLRPGGKVLVATANRDLFDFQPSPHSHRYYGVPQLRSLFEGQGFVVRQWGDTPVTEVSLRQRILRPVKWLAVKLNLMPGNKVAKAWLKRFVFGGLIRMPSELQSGMWTMPLLSVLPTDVPDRAHKVLLCEARLPDGRGCDGADR